MKDNNLSFRRIHFKATFKYLFFPLFVGGQTNLYVTRIDIPALDDMDCDGDLDIVTFNLNGGCRLYTSDAADDLTRVNLTCCPSLYHI